MCAQTVRQLLTPLSVPTYCLYWHLPSALSQEEGTTRLGQGGQASPLVQAPPFLSLNIARTTYLLWFALNRLGPGEEEKGMTAGEPDQRCPHPFILAHPPLLTPPPQYLLRPRLRRSPQARILFWASMCVRFPAFSPSMLSTQSPTATPACAALPPGVSWGEERSEAHGHTHTQAAQLAIPWLDCLFSSVTAPPHSPDTASRQLPSG